MTDLTPPAEWAAKEAVQKVNRLMGRRCWTEDGRAARHLREDGVPGYPELFLLAKMIEAHEKPPADPEVLAVRRIMSAIFKADGVPEAAHRYITGQLDEVEIFQAVLAEYKKINEEKASG